MNYSDAFLDLKRLETDPVADKVIEEMVREKGPEQARKMFHSLIRNIEMPLTDFPEIVQDYISVTNTLPKWADFEQIKIANELFLDHGSKFLLLLYYKSLPVTYSIAKGAPVLTQTGLLNKEGGNLEKFARRVAETGQFLIDVMDEDGLKPGGKGLNAIRKVRLIHGSVRYFLKHKGWKTEHLGEPINQEDLAITFTSFSVSLIDGLKQLGINEDPKKMDAFYHTWRAICSLIGVQVDLLPETIDGARDLQRKILERQSAPSQGGKELTASLVAFMNQLLPPRFKNNFPLIMIRHLNGDQMADYLGVPTTKGCLTTILPGFMKTQFKIMERLEDFGDPADILVNNISKVMVKKFVSIFDNYKQRSFSIPEKMQKRWD